VMKILYQRSFDEGLMIVGIEDGLD
jgi:hypothetical protein